MLLIHTESMGALRREMIESLGNNTARGLLTCLGYNAGARHAELMRRVRPERSTMDMFSVGTQLQMLQRMRSINDALPRSG
jgi:hypothetical protein